MVLHDNKPALAEAEKSYPGKFASERRVFSHIHRGDRIFIASGCGEPQYLVRALIGYVESHPKGFFDAEVIHLWTLGLAPYADQKFKRNFRHNSFFIGNSTREAVNEQLKRRDETPDECSPAEIAQETDMPLATVLDAIEELMG